MPFPSFSFALRGKPPRLRAVSRPCARRDMARMPHGPAAMGPREQEGPQRRLRGLREGREPGGRLSRRRGAQGRSSAPELG